MKLVPLKISKEIVITTVIESWLKVRSIQVICVSR
jgi:hypothetical protein